MLFRIVTYAVVALLAYTLRQSPFIQNLPFHLVPPDLPAQLARLPHGGAVQEAFTAHSSATLASTDRLAYCEDAVHLAGSDGRELVLVSCDPSRKRWNTVMGPLADARAGKGALWVVDPLAPQEHAVDRVHLEWAALDRGEVEFHPLGVAVHRDEHTGHARLFVVNHRAALSTVEVFSLLAPVSASALAARATHLLTLSHPTFTGAPNSIALLSPTSFFLSHDHHYTRRTRSLWGKLANLVETVDALPYSRVDYVDFGGPAAAAGASTPAPAVRVTPVARGLAFANGLALAPDARTLVVASTTRRELLFFDVDAPPPISTAAPVLTLRRTVKLPMLVDNLSLVEADTASSSSRSSSGGRALRVLAAGHPSYPALLSTARSLNLRVRLPGPLREWARTLGNDKWAEWEVAWRWAEQRGMSWVVEVRDPAAPPSVAGAEGDELETVYQSNGRIGEGGFGGSTTAVAGRGGAEGEERAWMVVAGLYEEGVRVIRE
ncbi:hypothetical protein JCM3770_005739 [Rhodotorula araucariae]